MSESTDEEDLPDGLYWLVDIPLFIDEERIGQFHDIVVQPLTSSIYQEQKVESEETESSQTVKKGGAKGEGKAKGKVAPPGLLEMLASADVSLKTTLKGQYEKQSSESYRTAYEFTATAPRQLAEISIHYDKFRQDRIHINQLPNDQTWRAKEEIDKTPRELVYLELPNEKEANQNEELVETKLVPVAAEFEDGAVEPLYEELIEHIHSEILDRASSGDDQDIESIMSYPERTEFEDPQELQEQRHEYWNQFQEFFEPKKAMEVVESAAKEHGRIDWIAFRLPLQQSGETLHLHLEPKKQYPNGTFAYNFIKRGQKHGLRLVGTLKSEPDMNVLAVYER
ncbi:hypothetical protein EI982_16850 [Haloplanus rallus]|uniref:Uncharacterized protein n=1 Tax=Haloplanus rallus TaxID=1816183 RepID=A0A6B9F702_9EURY|nr:hypothetical protein [Haloplanus rallus]QGX96325.1 hypothetical protein EI982_16850 [Haloplanus rallus]